MDPVALEKAFEMYPEVKLVVYAELYGFPGNIKQIKEICETHCWKQWLLVYLVFQQIIHQEGLGY